MNFKLLRLLIFIVVILHTNPARAFPPPEAFILAGGNILYPILLCISIFSVLLKYVWTKTKLYLLWRQHLVKILSSVFIISLLVNLSWLMKFPIKNHPIDIQTAKQWQQSGEPPVLADIQQQEYYNKAHLLGAISFPMGKGLADFLNTHPHKKVILYCSVGIQSANFEWLDVDMQPIKKALEENRLFYFPGGLSSLMPLKENNPFPVIINISSDYAQYLLKHPHYLKVNFTNYQDTLSNSLVEYQTILSQHDTPIINSPMPTNELTKEISALGGHQFIVTELSTDQPNHLLRFVFLCISLFFCALFYIRQKELLKTLFSGPSNYYQYIGWIIGFATTVVCLPFVLKLPIPFDFYLYRIHADLPMNRLYPILFYPFFGIIVLIHLQFPRKKRFDLLRLKLINGYTLAPDALLKPKLPSTKELLITFPIVGVISYIYTLAVVFFISVVLAIPLLVDLLLYFLYFPQAKNTSVQAFDLLKKCGYACDPMEKCLIELDTYYEPSLSVVTGVIDQQHVRLGLFSSDMLIDEADQSSGAREQLLIEKGIEKTELLNYCHLLRNLLIIFQQDIKICLNEKGNIISIHLYGNYLSARTLSRHLLLEHYRLVPDEINSIEEKRFISSPFQEVIENPTPLMLDVFKMRWSHQGGYLRALRKLGLLIKSSDVTQGQFVVFSNQLYLDKAFEKAIFSASKIHLFLRRKLIPILFTLAIERAVDDYHSFILPRTQLRLKKLADVLKKPLSVRQLKRKIHRALTVLSKESAMWQCYSSLLHQHAFNQLQSAAQKAGKEVSSLIQNPAHENLFVSSPYYDLSSLDLPDDFGIQWGKHDPCTRCQDAFLVAEKFRTNIRNLQLKEWQLIRLLLEKLRIQLKLPISLAYLTREELGALPTKKGKLRDLLKYRFDHWHLQNQWPFPAQFSLGELEQQSLVCKPNKNSEYPDQLRATRVSGTQQSIAGQAVLFEHDLCLEKLPQNSILVAENLSPAQLIACQHIKAVILEKGNYLSHAAILAREKNIPMFVQFQIATIKNNDQLMIDAKNKIMVFTKQRLDWDFIENMTEHVPIGNKAQRVLLMKQNGFNIPNSIILREKSIQSICELASKSAPGDASSAPLRQEYYEELNQLLYLFNSTQSPVIVRSSTNVEDAHHYSYAGLFYSETNIQTVDELISAIVQSWRAVNENIDVIQKYSGEKSKIVLNLLLQSYIHGEYGGVLFTESPTPGLMQLEISSKGVEGVAHGNALLASLHIDERGAAINSSDQNIILTQKQYQSLYELGRKIESLFGQPQDIE